jgi:hypothetical protein
MREADIGTHRVALREFHLHLEFPRLRRNVERVEHLRQLLRDGWHGIAPENKTGYYLKRQLGRVHYLKRLVRNGMHSTVPITLSVAAIVPKGDIKEVIIGGIATELTSGGAVLLLRRVEKNLQAEMNEVRRAAKRLGREAA